MIWKDTIVSVISILNFFKSIGSQTFMKTKIILKSNTIVFDPYNLFVFVNICLLVLFKKFNMDITEKMVSFQIIQNVLKVKCTLVHSISLIWETGENIKNWHDYVSVTISFLATCVGDLLVKRRGYMPHAQWPLSRSM